MEHGEEAARDEVEDAQVVGAHLLERVLAAGGDDGVVVGDLLVVDDAREREEVEAGDVLGGFGVLGPGADELGDGLDLGDHVAGEVARVGARVGERLVLLVAALGGGEGALGGEAEARVGLALERREVV